MEQRPCMVPWACSAGIGISSVPVGERNFWYCSFGITRLAEQANVPLVFTRKVVGTPAFARITRGEYPPFAVMSTICFPSTTETAVSLSTLVCLLLNQNAPKMRSALIQTEISTALFMLEVEKWIDNPRRRQCVKQIQ